jgi:hypothetical protein
MESFTQKVLRKREVSLQDLETTSQELQRAEFLELPKESFYLKEEKCLKKKPQE